MVKTKVRCPSCHKWGDLEIDKNIISGSKRGITAINVAESLICKHSFIIYLDKNLDVRDALLTDFTIELPEIKVKEEIDDKQIPTTEEVDVFLLIINLNSTWFTNVLRGYLFNKKVLIINDIFAIEKHIVNFLKFIFFKSFEIDVTVVDTGTYKKNKKIYKNNLVISKEKVVSDKEKVIDSVKMKYERAIVQKFLAETNPKMSLVIFRNEILKLFELSKKVIDIIDNLKEGDKVGRKEFAGNLEKQFNIKIPLAYFDFIMEIIKRAFNVDLSKISNLYFPELGF